jgi:hypothetical protein
VVLQWIYKSRKTGKEPYNKYEKELQTNVVGNFCPPLELTTLKQFPFYVDEIVTKVIVLNKKKERYNYTIEG